jgi:murein L,D-transpeptidase YafK
MIVLRLAPLSLVLVLGLGLAACEDTRQRGAARHSIPIPNDVLALMAEKGTTPRAPVLLRSFKKESELEVWKMGSNGQYALLKSYPICRWSGQLGPKKREGDRQAPEGFYTITPAQMNPNSSFYLSFNMGFPNAFDRAHNRTGAHLMVHGACSSSGCYSMSDDQIAEIYAIVREAHQGGQQGVQMQALPFRMTAENLARHRYDPNMPFWRNLKEGVDMFEVAKAPPRVSVCQARYAFNRVDDCREDPAAQQIAAAAAEKRRQDDAKVAALVASGTPAVRVVYQDGGQHQKFTQVLMSAGPEALEQKAAWGSRAVGVSRPDAILAGPQEVAMASPAAQAAPARGPQTPRIAPPRGQQPAAAEAPRAAETEVARAAVPAPAAEAPSMLQRVMSFNPFAAPQPATATFTPAAPAAPRAQAKPSPQASAAPGAASGVRVAQRPAPAAAD